MSDSDKPEITSTFAMELAQEIATALGWRLETSDYPFTFDIKRGDGAALWFEILVRERRVAVRGTYPQDPARSARGVTLPRDYGVDETPPAINASVDKGGRRIAADIKARFLPDYLRVYEACVSALSERETLRANTLVTAKRLATLLGTAHHGKDPSYLQIDGEGSTGDHAWTAKLAVTEDQAMLKLGAPAALIERVLCLLTDKRPPVNEQCHVHVEVVSYNHRDGNGASCGATKKASDDRAPAYLVTSLASLKRIPVGTKLRLVQNGRGPCDLVRVVASVTSVHVAFSGPDLEEKGGKGALSYLDFPEASQIRVEPDGFAIYAIYGGILARYRYED
jgi:hypothetical protein